MLRELILENFKAFGGRHVIPLAPITLLYGANSAGKSSIIQALLAVKQTTDAGPTATSPLLPRGDLVDLGSFRDLIFDHDIDRVCEISLIFNDQWAQRVSLMATPYRFRSRRVYQNSRGFLHGLSDSESSPVGTGWRLVQDPGRRDVRLQAVPLYGRNTSVPLYSLESIPGDNSLLSRSLVLQEVDRSHPFWTERYEEFTHTSLPTITRLVEKTKELINRRILRASRSDFDEDNEAISLLSDLFGMPRFRDNVNVIDNWVVIGKALESLSGKLANYSISDFFEDVLLLNQDVVSFRGATPDFMEPVDENKVSSGLRRTFDNETDELTHLVRLALISHVQRRGDLVDSIPDLTAISRAMSMGIPRLMSRMVYLGPMRDRPERISSSSGVVAQEVGKSGAALPDILFRQPQLVEQTNIMLDSFQIPYQLVVRSLQDPYVEDIFSVRLRDNRTNTVVSMLDVGFGIGQVLPVIVQSLLSQQQLILIEQPEIHLHPRLQAELGSLFLEGISSPQNNQFIIETHSEHLVLRLQRLIREGKLSSDDVCVLYVDRDTKGSKCERLRLDEDGDFMDRWPGGFFEESFNEILGL